MKHSYRSAITLMFLLACSEITPPGSDTQDDSFLAAQGVALDDSTAERVLDLVNAASVDTLDQQVPLDSRAALNIVEHRAGADRIDGSPDDDWFDDLQELDAIAHPAPLSRQVPSATRALTRRSSRPRASRTEGCGGAPDERFGCLPSRFRRGTRGTRGTTERAVLSGRT